MPTTGPYREGATAKRTRSTLRADLAAACHERWCGRVCTAGPSCEGAPDRWTLDALVRVAREHGAR